MCEKKLKWASKKCRKTCDLCDPNKIISTDTPTVTRETTNLLTENTIQYAQYKSAKNRTKEFT